jgi:hypothetical protein
MRSPLATALAAILFGLGGLASVAGANSLTLVPTGPTSLGSVGETTTFDIVMQLDPYVVMGEDLGGPIAAVAQVDVAGAARIISGTNDMAGTNLYTANFKLRELSFMDELGTCSVAGTATTCTYADGAPSAGNIGGITLGTSNLGTYTIGSYTLQAFSVGTTTVSIRFRPGGYEWFDVNLNVMPFPTTNTLVISTPEPSTAALIGLGLAGLVAVGRRSRA